MGAEQAKKGYALAKASLLLAALAVAYVAGAVRVARVRNLYGAAETFDGVSAPHIHRRDSGRGRR